MKEITIAKLSIRGLPDFSATGKKSIIKWLQNQIKAVQSNKKYSKLYVARYIVTKK